MPKTFDDLFDAVAADVSSRTRAPGMQDVIRSSRHRSVGLAAASAVALAVLVVSVLSLTLLNGGPSRVEPAPEPSPGLDVGDVPVWYDDDGLHHGDIVEDAAVPVTSVDGSAFSLVRTGALYQDARNGEIWYHPWGGQPRVVGTDLEFLPAQGPASDPEGDNAAWFEGGELVVYNTAASTEIARVKATRVEGRIHAEHAFNSNGVLQVSDEAVVWTADNMVRRLDLGTQSITELGSGTASGRLEDVHDLTELWSSAEPELGLVIRSAGIDKLTFAAFREGIGSFSPDGRFVLGVTSKPHGSGFVDVANGEFFALPEVSGDFYAVNGWSYGSTALIVADWEANSGGGSSLLACYPERRECDELPRSGNVILPWS